MLSSVLLHPTAARVFFLFLLALIVIRGVVPAVSSLDTDFPNYYTASRLLVNGAEVERLYDDVWFQEQITTFGMEAQGKFSPFPPITALVLVPLAFLKPLAALQLMTGINIILASLSVLLLQRTTRLSLLDSALVITGSGIGLINCLRFGQLYILIAFSLLLGYHAYTRKQYILSGICFGVFIPVKYYPVVFLLAFVIKKEWRVIASALITCGLVWLLGLVILGWELHRQFLVEVLPFHLNGELSLQNPFASTFQSFDSLLRRMFVYDAAHNSHPVLDAPLLFVIGKIIILTSTFVVLWRVFRRAGWRHADHRPLLILPGIAALMVAPATATYHFVLLWMPIGLILSYSLDAMDTRGTRLIFWTYLLLGVIPYSLFRSFDDAGWVSLLAYPRLLLVVTLFILILNQTYKPVTLLRKETFGPDSSL